jgi:hypothetical protein
LKTIRFARFALALVAAAGLSVAAEQSQPQIQVEKPAPAAPAPSATGDDDVKEFLGAISAIGSIFAGAAENDGSANSVVQGETPAATAESNKTESGEPVATEKRRSAKNSMILVTGGAAAGAAIGRAAGKGTRGMIVGAAIGAAAGLIYDRATFKNPGKI